MDLKVSGRKLDFLITCAPSLYLITKLAVYHPLFLVHALHMLGIEYSNSVQHACHTWTEHNLSFPPPIPSIYLFPLCAVPSYYLQSAHTLLLLDWKEKTKTAIQSSFWPVIKGVTSNSKALNLHRQLKICPLVFLALRNPFECLLEFFLFFLQSPFKILLDFTHRDADREVEFL